MTVKEMNRINARTGYYCVYVIDIYAVSGCSVYTYTFLLG